MEQERKTDIVRIMDGLNIIHTRVKGLAYAAKYVAEGMEMEDNEAADSLRIFGYMLEDIQEKTENCMNLLGEAG